MPSEQPYRSDVLLIVFVATYTYPAESSTVSYVGDVPVDNPPGYDA